MCQRSSDYHRSRRRDCGADDGYHCGSPSILVTRCAHRYLRKGNHNRVIEPPLYLLSTHVFSTFSLPVSLRQCPFHPPRTLTHLLNTTTPAPTSRPKSVQERDSHNADTGQHGLRMLPDRGQPKQSTLI